MLGTSGHLEVVNALLHNVLILSIVIMDSEC